MPGALGLDAGAARLLERSRELEVLDRAIEGVVAGRSGLVLIEGQAGIGKSRLVAEARRRATESGLIALFARGGELEQDFPFGVVRQLFELRFVDAEARQRLLSGSAASAATIFDLPGERAGDDTSGEWTFAALHGLYWLTVNLSAEAPLVLAVDDLHWCDRTSLRFLAYLARRLEGLPVIVVGSLRSSEPGADDALISELMSDPAAQVLTPAPLSPDAGAEVVRERLGADVAPAFAEACHVSTQGNPLFLRELLNALEVEHVPADEAHVDVVSELGPRAASRAVLLRLARLPAEGVMVARSVAVLGDGADPTLIGELAELDAETVAAASRELVRAEILRPDSPFGFVHPLVQAAVYRDLAPGERELGHARAARLLYVRNAPAEQVAAQLLKIPPSGEGWITATLRKASDAAFAKGAPDAAIASLRRLLEEPLPADLRAELSFELGRAQALTSLPDSADALRDAYETAGDAELRGHAADWLACTLIFMEAPDEAAEVARRAALALPQPLDDLGLQLEAGELISLFFGSGDDGERLERLRGHRTIDTERGLGARKLAAVAAWEWAESAGPADEVVALARRALQDDAILAADAGYIVVAAILPLALADLDEAIVRWEEVRAEAHRRGFVFTNLAVQVWGGYTHYLRGELQEAESELRAALVTAADWGVPMQRPWASAVLAELLVERGAVAEARALLDAASDPHPGSDPAMLLDRAELRVLLAEGRAEEALVHAEVFERRAGWRRHPRYVPWRSLKAQALDRLGRLDEAIALAADEVAIARAWGSPGTLGRSLRVLGTLERADGLDTLEEACGLLEHEPAGLERAKALASLGAALRRARRPTEAREPLRKALELADVCGATALVESTRAELYATGARPRATALSGVGALTSSERRVADLAAEGLSNRDIAQTLFVTPKTVEVHLTNAYRKLGIGSRKELPAALASGTGREEVANMSSGQ